MGRLQDIRIVDQVLTNICRGYSNDIYIGNSLFPVVTVDKSGGKIPLWGKEAFRVHNTERALRADSNRIDGGWLSLDVYALTEHDLEMPIDYQEIDEATIPIEQKYSKQVMDMILLGIEKEQADLAQALTTYPTGNKVTLASNYFNEPTVDWIEYIHQKNAALKSKIAKPANTLIIGQHVWDLLKFHAKLKTYITVNTDMFNMVPTIAKLQEVLDIPKVLVGGALYSTDASDNFGYVWGNNIILAHVVDPPTGIARDIYDPCFGYTLRKKGFPFSDTYEEKKKIQVVRNTDNYQVKVVGAESAYIINNPIDPAVYAA